MSEQSSDGIDRSAYGGAVDSEVSYFRDSDGLVYYRAIKGVTCHQCAFGEVWQPMQTMDMPIVYSCLRCGTTAPADDFHRSVNSETEQ